MLENDGDSEMLDNHSDNSANQIFSENNAISQNNINDNENTQNKGNNIISSKRKRNPPKRFADYQANPGAQHGTRFVTQKQRKTTATVGTVHIFLAVLFGFVQR